jgi:DNA (cytosine-5)-methyltransferase 1
VQADLEAEGYEVLPFLLPACAINAPHRRDRIWFIAYSISASKRANKFRGIQSKDGKIEGERIQTIHNAFRSDGLERITADSNSIGRENALENGELERGRFGKSYKRNFWHSFPSVSPVCDGNDGISDRLDGITFSKWRAESIKAGGNAIVPQVAYQIFKTIAQYETIHGLG